MEYDYDMHFTQLSIVESLRFRHGNLRTDSISIREIVTPMYTNRYSKIPSLQSQT